LSFASRTRDTFEYEEIEFLETISHYVTLAYERLHLIDQLREQDRRKDEFLATLAHELRNPLAPIRNGLELIRLSGSDETMKQHATTIMQRQVDQMVRLVDDLLDVARISQGKITLRREIVDLRAVVDLAIDSERHRLNAKRQRLRVEVAPGPTHVHGDPARLQQIVSNLLNNASKYTAADGDIAVELTSEAGHATLTVRDNGAGIPADKLASIFDLFFQLETPLARSEGGLGIGLTLVHRLVEQHGGTITAASPGVGRGSTFVVTLPLAPAPRESATAAAPAAHVPCHVLLIEDNDDAREALRAGLELAGYRVTVAADGASGIDRATTLRPDVAVVDVGLPGVDGYAVARRLREKFGRAIVLVALTGYSQPEDRRRALDAGFDVHLPKPAGVDDLARVLNRSAD
jgi:CheY-like chemotaxis protein